MRILMANRFDSYDQAWSAYYEGVVPTYGATRMEWGFGKWAYLDSASADGDRLAFWGLLDEIGILTADGRKRLKRARRESEVAK